MGCDIHWYVEVQDENGKWNFVGSEFIYDVDGLLNASWIGEDEDTLPYIYNTRSYYIFSQLAGVRKEMCPEVGYIPPRGIPEDCSDEYRMFVDWWGIDGHSHSWLLLNELYGIDRFPSLVLDTMKELGPSDKVRAVFFFDN